MPYPESCPECGSTFRNTGTHFTARRNEVGRHVLLELGCQNTTRRFWWDFTTGNLTEDGRPASARRAEPVHAGSASNGSLHAESNGHVTLSTLDRPDDDGDSSPAANHLDNPFAAAVEAAAIETAAVEAANVEAELERLREVKVEVPTFVEPATPDRGDDVDRKPQTLLEADAQPQLVALAGLAGGDMPSLNTLKDAFVRQLQLDRLTLRQMRSWLMAEEARRAIEVAAGATEGTYERLALILFGCELPQLLGTLPAAPQSTGMSAEERLELQREKARIRARLRRAAAKAART